MAQLRVNLLQDTGELQNTSDIQAFMTISAQYFTEAISNRTYIGWVAESEGQLVGTGGVNVFRRLPYPANPVGEEWYLLNMYTLPAYRGFGIGSAITRAAIDYAKASGVHRVWLDATDEGKPVYEKVGFIPTNTGFGDGIYREVRDQFTLLIFSNVAVAKRLTMPVADD